MTADRDDPDRTKVSLVDPWAGTVLDRRYRIDFRLAAGGFGAIYRATHVIHGREVALKVLHPNLATDPGVVARFRREAAALGRLRSSHAITAFDFGEAPDGTMYIVMELLEGESLYEVYRAHGPLPWRRMIAIARQVCSALSEAHALGIVHRDLKPANILHGTPADEADGLTRTGQMIGTFDYMAPEQMVGGVCSGRSDIFTLGIVIYEMIAGERPYGEPNTSAAMLAALLTHTPPALSSRAPVPSELDPIVARCIAREADDRYATVDELAADLERVLAASDDDLTKTRVHAAVVPDDATWIDEAPRPIGDDGGLPPAGSAGEARRGSIEPPGLRTTLPGVLPPWRRR